VVWPSHHCDAQNSYDLEKINVEWSAQNNDYDLEKKKCRVVWHSLKNYEHKVLVPKNALEKNRWRVEMFTNKNVRNKTIFE
jgi:hypothetical protein